MLYCISYSTKPDCSSPPLTSSCKAAYRAFDTPWHLLWYQLSHISHFTPSSATSFLHSGHLHDIVISSSSDTLSCDQECIFPGLLGTFLLSLFAAIFQPVLSPTFRYASVQSCLVSASLDHITELCILGWHIHLNHQTNSSKGVHI